MMPWGRCCGGEGKGKGGEKWDAEGKKRLSGVAIMALRRVVYGIMRVR